MAVKILPDQAYLRQCFDYDEATGVLIWKTRPAEHFADDVRFRRWNTKFAGKVAGSAQRDPIGKFRLSVGLDQKVYNVPRVAWKLMTDQDPDQVDHIDQNPMNNAWSNLRNATAVQNCQNRWGGNKTGLPKGVRPIRARFFATICVDGKRRCLGFFATAEDAGQAYKDAAAKFFGEFAHLGH